MALATPNIPGGTRTVVTSVDGMDGAVLTVVRMTTEALAALEDGDSSLTYVDSSDESLRYFWNPLSSALEPLTSNARVQELSDDVDTRLATKAESNAYDRSSHYGTQLASTVMMANGNTLEAEIQRVISLMSPGGATAPVPNAAPSIAFPGGTGDVGETATITAGTYTVTQPTSVLWGINVNGTRVGTTATTTFTVPTEAGVSPRALSVTELFNWANGTAVAGLSSPTYTINAPAAVPIVVAGSGPTITGTPQVGSSITLNSGSYSPAVSGADAYTYTLYQNAADTGTILAGPTAQAGATLAYTVAAGLAGASLYLKVVPKNASGSGVAYYSAAFVISGGTAPTYVSDTAIQPGWLSGTYEVGQTLTMDFGEPANNASSFQYQVRRDGANVAGAAGISSSRYATYVAVLADAKKMLSYSVIPSNVGGGAGPIAYSDAIFVEESGAAPPPVAGGSLSAAVAASSGTVNITTGGSVDWKVFPNAAGVDWKSGAGNTITHASLSGTLADSANTLSNTLQWTDGTNTASSSSNTGLLALWNTTGRGIRITVPVGTTERTVKIYFTGYSANLLVSASLSDSSATPASVNADSGASVTSTWTATIVATAGSAAQTLTIDISQASFYGTGGDSRYMGVTVA